QNAVYPDSGSFANLGGTGNIIGFGKVYAASATFYSVGFVSNGTAHGTLFIAGSKGTLTLSLTATTPQSGPAPLPGNYTYKTVAGTGKFWNTQDQGIASLTLTPKHKYGPVTLGTFVLTIASNAVTTTVRSG